MKKPFYTVAILLTACLYNNVFSQSGDCYSSGDPIGIISGRVSVMEKDTLVTGVQYRITAYDSDNNADDLMCQTLSDDNGSFRIRYDRTKDAWDPKIPGFTTNRPDIYIYVEVYSEEDRIWYPIYRSAIIEDHRMSSNAIFNPVIHNNVVTNTTCFTPDEHGWKFSNSFDYHAIVRFMGTDIVSPDPLGRGLCGGMCFSVLDRYYRGQPISEATALPEIGSSTTNYLTNRQQTTMKSGAVPAKVLDWILRSDEAHTFNRHSVGHLTKEEIGKTIAKINAGQPTTLVLVRGEGLSQLDAALYSHQIVVYAYEKSVGKITFFIYDPNYPKQEDELTVYYGIWKNNKIKVFLEHDSGRGKERERGFFINYYDKTKSPEDVVANICGEVRFASAKRTLVASPTGCISNIPTDGESYWYSGEEIIFKPGFTTAAGSNFTAYIDPCYLHFVTSGLATINNEESDEANALEDRNSEDKSQVSNSPASTDFNLYPNPSNGVSTIAFNLTTPGQVIVNMYNIQGQIVEQIRGAFDKGQHEFTLNTSHTLPNGMYIVRLQVGDIHTYKSLILEN